MIRPFWDVAWIGVWGPGFWCGWGVSGEAEGMWNEFRRGWRGPLGEPWGGIFGLGEPGMRLGKLRHLEWAQKSLERTPGRALVSPVKWLFSGGRGIYMKDSKGKPGGILILPFWHVAWIGLWGGVGFG